MRLVSTTIAHNAEDLIGAAIASVIGLVDEVILIDTGITDRTVERARATCEGRVRFRLHQFEWLGNFAEARNYALTVAGWSDADMVVTLDTDERLQWARILRDAVNYFPEITLCYDEARSYAKERFIRLPLKSGAKWVGRVHECFLLATSATQTTPYCTFTETVKTPAEMLAKFQRDRDALEQMVREAPKDSRWWLYLGETYKNLGDTKAATTAYWSCLNRSTWDEERAWAYYRIAEINAAEGQYGEAMGYAGVVLQNHPGFAEAAWLAGWCSFQLGRYRDAIYWSRMAKAIGEAGKAHEIQRIGFRHLPAYAEGPADVERWAWKKLRGEE